MKKIKEIIFVNESGSDEGIKEAEKYVKKAVKTAAGFFKFPAGYQVSVTLVDEDHIRELNREYRSVDSSTDVLSFPLEETDPRGARILGDIVLCRDVAVRQAEEFCHSLERELSYLSVHSFLHLMGYDHMDDEEKLKMRSMEKRIMRKMGVFKNMDRTEASKEDLELIRLATQMLDMAYCPYSGYHVGAALLTSSGKIYTGCNIENASYSATICAERTAAVKAVSEGERHFVKVAIACSGDSYAYPCGVCRQFLNEFADDDFEVIVIKGSGEWEKSPFRELLPHGFRGKDMGIDLE